jgi:hypothetical protein
MDLDKLRETAPRAFAIVQDPGGGPEVMVIGWGLQLVDRAIFAWCGSDSEAGQRSSVGVFASADSALWMAEICRPARLVWMQSIEPGA